MGQWHAVLILCCLAGTILCTEVEAQQPRWVSDLGYNLNEVFPISQGSLGRPRVQVGIGDSVYWLLFDTGNMVGVTLATTLLEHLQLPGDGHWDSYDSDGQVIGRYRRFKAPVIYFLGSVLKNQTIFEFVDNRERGLIGPDAVPGTRFTMDYRAGVLAVTGHPVHRIPNGFTVLPLTRSNRHPRLILTLGYVNGRQVLIEFDTGASRCNIDQVLVRELNLPQSKNGASIDSLQIGPLVFSVTARVNPKSGIDRTLNPPILLAVGSDILKQFIMTIDYASGLMFLENYEK